MSEAMASEMIAEAQWLLRGYWTKLRYVFETPMGRWSDVDVLAYDPEKRHLVICECKVRGGRADVFAYTMHRKSIFKYDTANYLSFVRHIPLLCKDDVIFANFPRMVKKVTVQLVSNYAIATEQRENVENEIATRIRKRNLRGAELEIKVDTTINIFADVLERERRANQGRRYGNPIIDVAREINRFVYPKIHDAGYDTRSKETVRNESLNYLWKALGLCVKQK